MIKAFFQRASLYRKFIIVTSFAILVFMIGIGSFITTRESRIMYNDIEQQGRLLANTLAIPIINDLIYERLGLVEEGGLIDNYITEIFNRKDMDLLYIAVLDEKGRVLSHNDFTEYGKIYNDPLTLKALHSNTTVVQRFHDEDSGHDAIDFATPLSIGRKRWGTLKFAISLEKLENEVNSTILQIIILTFGALLAGFIIIILLGKRFIRPITSLAETMQKAGTDNLDVRVDVRGNDELAFLGQSFNQMIDRIKEASLQLKRTHEKLLQTEKLASIGILASGVAHEINNPLGGLFNAVEMLEQNGDREDFRRRYLELIREGLNRIETTVGKLLWMSRKGERRPQWVDIREVLKDIKEFIDYKLRKNNIVYKEHIEEGLSVFIDRHDLHQIMLNLLINAEQAMGESGGTLTVSAYRDNSRVIIEVSDTGEGIDERDIGKIFDPFFTTKKPKEGTGLGLWLTYEIVKSYNGDISVKSKKGEGTTFTIELIQKQ